MKLTGGSLQVDSVGTLRIATYKMPLYSSFTEAACHHLAILCGCSCGSHMSLDHTASASLVSCMA